MYACHTTHVRMAPTDKPEEVKQWFQDTIRGLWPIAVGSLSLRKSPCVREHCRACESGEGHSRYALYGRKGKRRFSIYVPRPPGGLFVQFHMTTIARHSKMMEWYW